MRRRPQIELLGRGPLPAPGLGDRGAVCAAGVFAARPTSSACVEDFHRVHEEVFAVATPSRRVEIVAWRARARCPARRRRLARSSRTRSSRALEPIAARSTSRARDWSRRRCTARSVAPAAARWRPGDHRVAGLTTIVLPPGAGPRRLAERLDRGRVPAPGQEPERRGLESRSETRPTARALERVMERRLASAGGAHAAARRRSCAR